MVVMVDPDAPSHAVGEFYLHWMVMNIPVILRHFHWEMLLTNVS